MKYQPRSHTDKTFIFIVAKSLLLSRPHLKVMILKGPRGCFIVQAVGTV